MADVVSIELLLDRATEERVRDDWRRLADAGLSSLAAHTSPSNRPHVTLLVRATVPPVDFAAAGRMLPVSIELAEPVVFAHGDRGVLAWRVAVTDAVTALHEAVHSAVPTGANTDAPHTKPGEWTPHVTLARRLRLDRLDEARSLLGPPLSGAGIALRRWDAAEKRVTEIGGRAL